MIDSAVLHGGDNDSTGCIAGAFFGACYGFTGVPDNHTEHLEYRQRLTTLGKQLLSVAQVLRSKC